MKYLAEFRDGEIAQKLAAEIRAITTRPWAIMEVCGGQTHSILRNGIDQLLPEEIELIHGPGCPVCVTPLDMIDKALAIAALPNVIFTSFGDMLRVPGSEKDLFRVKSEGGDVRIIYSPLDAVQMARENPTKQVVFFGIGFETTAPANAMAVFLAKKEGLKNFSMLVSHVLVPPAIDAIMSAPGNRVQAFLAAGHVCSVMGFWQYPPLASEASCADRDHRLRATRRAGGDPPHGAVPRERRGARGQRLRPRGDLRWQCPAQALLEEVFTVTDRAWRGIGVIPQSGWRLSDAYADYDAEHRFDVGDIRTVESALCRAGEVLQGSIKPSQCEAFGKQCTPRTPLGATMVSSEGACAAYYNYGRFHTLERASLARATVG